MKFPILLSFLLIITACTNTKKVIAPLVKKPSSGVITYQVTLDEKAKAQGMEEVMGKMAIATFNDTLLRLETPTDLPGQEFTITNLNSMDEVTYLEMNDKKYAIKSPPALSYSKSDILLTPETKEIAGFLCKKATVKAEEDITLDIYYTDAIGANYSPTAPVNGFALAYSITIGGGVITYTASEVKLGKIESINLYPADDYKKVTMREFQMELMNNMPKMPIGVPGPAFSKNSLTNQVINLESLRGKVVVINFWFTACKPCEIEMPDLNELKKAYAGQEVEFLAITFDPAEKVQDFLDKKQMFDFTIIPNASEVVQEYQIYAFPTTVILDKNGNIADSKMGSSLDIKAEIETMIEAAKKL